MYRYLYLKKPGLPVALGVLSACVTLLAPSGAGWLSYDRESIINGELWRVVTSHFTHTGSNHLAVNIFGLIVVFLLFGHLVSTRSWLLSMAACMSGVSFGLFVNNPELTWYMGLSGVLHGLIVVGAIATLKKQFRFSLVVLTAVFSKLVVEQLYGPSQGAMKLINAPVIIDAHLYGAISGLVCGVLYLVTNYYLARRCTGIQMIKG